MRSAVPVDVCQVPWNPAGTLQALSVVCDPETMERRAFTPLTAGAMLAPTIGWSTASPSNADAHPGPGIQITDQVVDDADMVNSRLRIMDERAGGEALLQLTHSHIRYLHSLITNGRYSNSVGLRLHSSIAEALRTGGIQASDIGRHGLAQQMWTTALHTAHSAGDQALAANIVSRMSDHATDHEVAQAVPLAEAALGGYRGSDHKVKAILYLRAAKAYGYSGDLTACRRAIDATFDS